MLNRFYLSIYVYIYTAHIECSGFEKPILNWGYVDMVLGDGQFCCIRHTYGSALHIGKTLA